MFSFFLIFLLLCDSKKICYQTREFRAKLHLKPDIGFQVQFNAAFPHQVMNCPIVFFDVAIKIQSIKDFVSVNAFTGLQM